MNVLAISSSRVGNGGYLESAVPLLRPFLGAASLQLAFIPFAAVDGDYKGYASKVREGLSPLGHTIHIVTPEGGEEIIRRSDAVIIGGGNTFKLLHDLYAFGLFGPIQSAVANGTPYVGWSAGANLTGRTICTTNDMPVIQPESFDAFSFFPFQLNPHYYNVTTVGFHGETRDQRLAEFLHLHPGVPVVGLPEGAALQLTGEKLTVVGEKDCVLFTNSAGDRAILKADVPGGTDVSYLLRKP